MSSQLDLYSPTEVKFVSRGFTFIHYMRLRPFFQIRKKKKQWRDPFPRHTCNRFCIYRIDRYRKMTAWTIGKTKLNRFE